MALWSYRSNVPTAGEGKSRVAIPFDNWFAHLTGVKVERVEPELPEISDEELEFFVKVGKQEFNPMG